MYSLLDFQKIPTLLLNPKLHFEQRYSKFAKFEITLLNQFNLTPKLHPHTLLHSTILEFEEVTQGTPSFIKCIRYVYENLYSTNKVIKKFCKSLNDIEKSSV